MSRKVLNKEFQLMDSINLVANIQCSKCYRDGETICFGLDEAMQEFYAIGWRATKKLTYCKSCAKKYLKKNL